MAAPTITDVNPATGSGDGGEAVLITGTDLTGATAVAFGTVAATSFNVQSDTEISATAPAHAAGAVRVKVTNADGDSADTSADDFTYTAPTAALCTSTQVKTRGRIEDSDNDDLIDELITLALTRLNAATGREFLPQVTEARTFRVDGRVVNLKNSDLRDVSSVVLHPGDDAEETLTEDTDFTFELERRTNTARSLLLSDNVSLESDFSSNFGFAQVTITGDWGMWSAVSEVAADVNMAAIECVLSWMDKAIAEIAGVQPMDQGTRLPVGSPAWDIPTSAFRKLVPYTRSWGVR